MKRDIIEIVASDTVPSVELILIAQGVPSNAALTEKIKNLADRAIATYSDIARPSGIIMPIGKSDFEDIYSGEGLNATETPLDSIVQGAETFCLFAVTVGAEVTNKITALFDICEFALAAMLDSAASEGTEMAAQLLGDHYIAYLKDGGMLDKLKCCVASNE